MNILGLISQLIGIKTLRLTGVILYQLDRKKTFYASLKFNLGEVVACAPKM